MSNTDRLHSRSQLLGTVVTTMREQYPGDAGLISGQPPTSFRSGHHVELEGLGWTGR